MGMTVAGWGGDGDESYGNGAGMGTSLKIVMGGGMVMGTVGDGIFEI